MERRSLQCLLLPNWPACTCDHGTSQVAYLFPILAKREPVAQQRGHLCAFESSSLALSIEVQLASSTGKSWNHACGASCLGSNQSTRTSWPSWSSHHPGL